MKRSTLVAVIILFVLVLDQALKFYIKLNFEYGQTQSILGLTWAKLHFVENEGMAYGLSYGGATGKLILSLFRIVLIGFLFYLIHGLIKRKEKMGVIFCISMIIAGAIGNVIDGSFYGVIFSESPRFHGGVASLFPADGGYASFLHGHVVDMLYFPMINTTLPTWVPIWGGERFSFFDPVFNLADSSIFAGVVSLILFYPKYILNGELQSKKK